MANPITFQGVAAPDFRSSNSMQNEAVKSLLLAGQQIKDAVGAYTQKRVDRNQALLQDYINQAKTPEELQSESFKQGYANLVSSFKGEVDPLKASGYLDGRLDSLTKRMADQTSIEANKFRLAQDQINAPIQTDLLKTQLGGAEEALRFAQANNPNVLAKNKVDADVALATQGDVISNKKLANQKLVEDMANERRRLQLEAERIDNERKRILEGGGGGGFTLQNGEAAISDGISNIRKIQQDALNGVSDKFSYKDMDAVDKAILKDEKLYKWFGLTSSPDTAKKVKELITKNPELSKLPNQVKATIYMDAVSKIREGNIWGKDDWFFQNDDKYLNAVIDSAKENTGYLSNAQRMETAAIQDLASKLSRMSQGKIDYLKAYAYVQSQLGASPLASMSIDGKALDTIKKAGSKDVPVVIPQATLGNSLDGGATWFKPRQ